MSASLAFTALIVFIASATLLLNIGSHQ